MSPAVIEHIATAACPPSELADRAPTAAAAPVPVRASNLPMLRKLALSIAVWMLYVPHLAILDFLGPRAGPVWARSLARFHWLLTFFGAQRSVRNMLRRLHRQFHSDYSASTILRKHLELKHECFARFKVFNRNVHDDRGGDLIWEIDSKMRERFDRARSSGKGLIIVGYHFGFFRLSTSVIPQAFPSCDAVYVSHRVAHYNRDTISSVADLALQKAISADKQSGARIHYIEPVSSIVRIYRMLLAGETVALAADGAFAKDFLDVPFLDGKLRVPCGWARVAAATHANVLILFDTMIDRRRRRMWVFDHVQASDKSPEAIYAAVAESARVLEEFVRREPWAWHPWQRLSCERADDGSQVLVINELGHAQNIDQITGRCDAGEQTKMKHRGTRARRTRKEPAAAQACSRKEGQLCE